ncbi:CsbD family protein [Noviherbaspirillum sp.]|uniref:CsbD family protein n=1 Tax=Noviherbaspirillum sp. TaxID=1926288 RepID=UPI002FE224A5
MNQDQVKGSIKDVAGKLQRKAGEALNDKNQQTKGTDKQVEGKTQKIVGNIKDSFGK